jgi:anaerobic magnesium-protoporphyrin IX monomethyl ester cyclase
LWRSYSESSGSVLKRVKVLLIYPYFLEQRVHEEEISIVPIGLYYVGALLKEKGYDVHLLNWHRIDETPQEIEKTLRQEKPDVIGFSLFHANRWGAIDIARKAKALDPHVKIVFGGIGATFLWEHFLTHFPEVDFIVLGEGEYSFLNLVKSIEGESPEGVERIHGIAYRKGGRPFRTEQAAPIEDLDRLPIPSKHFVYQHVSSTRGCPWNCTFCGSPQFWGRKIRFHSPEYFVEQIERLYRKGVTFLYVSDDTFTVKKDRVVEICKKILEKKLKITWVAISRVNDVNDEVLYWMRKAGCIQISYGIESGSQAVRDRLNKNIREDQVKQAFALTKKYGILPRAYFIYGCPGEDQGTIQETLDLMDEIKPLSTIFYILDVFPGTALYEDIKRKIGLTDDMWLDRIEDILYFETDSHLNREMILDFGKELRTAFQERLHLYADAIELSDRKDLYPSHADFLSRLGMTFSQGDYSLMAAVKEKEKTAEKLFTRALTYFPDHRAYLGLGMLRQNERRFADSVQILAEGVEYFKESEALNLCLGISLMNLGEFQKALTCLLKFQDSQDAACYIAQCYRALGDSEREAAFERRFGGSKGF